MPRKGYHFGERGEELGDERITDGFQIHNMLTDLGLKFKSNHEGGRDIHVKKLTSTSIYA